MRRIPFILFIFTATAFCDLPIMNTPFHKDSIQIVREQALQNNSNAQIEMALRLYAGYQIEADPVAAFSWMRKAAEQGDSDAQFLLSRMFAEGIGTSVDMASSDVWFAKALVADPENKRLQEQYEASLISKEKNPAERNKFLQLCSDAGYAPAFVALREPVAIDLYSKGKFREARKIFQSLADKNRPVGFYWLAKMVEKGEGGLPEDTVHAFDLYAKAAKAGQPLAQYRMAQMLENGEGTDKDPAAAANEYEKAAQNGNADAQYKTAEITFASAARWFEQASLKTEDKSARLECMKRYKKDLFRSVEWYRKAAEGKGIAAQYMLGRLYASGEGVVWSADKALQYYQQAAGQGHAESLFYIGLMYQAGLGIPKDIGKAVSFYQKAAKKGSLGALFYLGNCYSFGVGVEKSPKKGEEFYQKVLEGIPAGSAADGGDAQRRCNRWVLRAAREYALILWRKAGSEEDRSAARTWMSLVARSGDADARAMRIQMTTGPRKGSLGKPNDISGSGREADPSSDARAKRRDSVFLSPYLQVKIRDIYPKFTPPKIIAYVTPRGNVQSITGATLWELSVKYKRPVVRDSVGLRGALLLGVELEDKKTGELYWAFNEIKDMDTVFSGQTFMDLSMFVDVAGHNEIRIRNWGVLYGHLMDNDRRMLAVLDQKGKSTESLDQMASENRFSKKLDSMVTTTIDIDARFPSEVDNSAGDDTKDNSLMDSILGPITGK